MDFINTVKFYKIFIYKKKKNVSIFTRYFYILIIRSKVKYYLETFFFGTSKFINYGTEKYQDILKE